MVAGTHSGVGKTSVAAGLMAALRRRGHRVAPAKVGPDFIDPGYHELATGRPGRNLDAWMSGAELMAPLAGRAAAGSDLLVIEGVMGLFDGAADGTASSTADVAALLDAPVLLVVDCSSQAGSVAALVHGFATFDPHLHVAGVVLNKLASPSHEAMVRAALAAATDPVPVVGALHRDARLNWRDRHLGLVPVAERRTEAAAALDALASLVDSAFDLNAIVAIAQCAPDHPVAPVPEPKPVGPARIAVAAGNAFTFTYRDNIESLSAAGATIVAFDPLVDAELPEGTDAVVVGGGFPEVMVDQLGQNRRLSQSLRRHLEAGRPIWAECGGLLWLARSLDGHPMVGAVPTDAVMTDRLTLGYRRARLRVDAPIGPAGTELRGHEFHYTTVDPPGDALALSGRQGTSTQGFAAPNVLASYLHVHLAARPDLAEAFVTSAVVAAQRLT